MARGGKREGAGRKPALPQDKRVTVTVKVSPETKRKLDELKNGGCKIGRLFDELVAGILT